MIGRRVAPPASSDSLINRQRICTADPLLILELFFADPVGSPDTMDSQVVRTIDPICKTDTDTLHSLAEKRCLRLDHKAVEWNGRRMVSQPVPPDVVAEEDMIVDSGGTSESEGGIPRGNRVSASSGDSAACDGYEERSSREVWFCTR
ncbi:hypothetical protein GB937_008245 [Aspergillus fischeri]|nr:hypothetical protein GB937_008245 [Aspergillus fischeri]